MSGFVGILQRDRRPIDAARFGALAGSLAFRAPDGTRTWHLHGIGLAHARLVTDPARDGEPQPLALDDRFWIAGHVHLDARDELIGLLCHSERSEESRHASDAALVLRAYRAWGDACLDRLHGDFAFALWDEREQRLFCARDRFGVRPFFYAAGADAFVFGNTLECLRRDRAVDLRLDEAAIADYLVFGHLREPERSFFAGIRRLPAAHSLVATAGSVTVRRYWSLPVEDELRHRDPREYVGEFAALLGRAVADRAPPGSVALHLSGGLDSGCIGAALAGKFPGAAAHGAAHGFCIGWNSAFEDPEPGFARLSAQALGLPLSIHEEPDCEPLKGWDDFARIEPEPSYDIYRQLTVDSLAPVAAHARVALDGQGGDEVFQREYVLDEWRRAPLFRLLGDVARTFAATGTRPPLGLREQPASASIPEWLDPRWRNELGLDERLHRLGADVPDRALPRARARARLTSPLWGPYFESYDAGLTRAAVEVRWPLLDERLVSFALRLPPFPWTLGKHLQREAIRGQVPPAISERPKTALAGDPLAAFLVRQPGWLEAQRWTKPWLAGRVDYWAWKQSWQTPALDTDGRWARLRATGLAHWLRREASPLRAP